MRSDERLMDRVPSQPDLARPALYPGAPAWSIAGAQDWAATPLGPAEAWPQSLKTAASIVLGSTVPMFLAWGPDLLLLYNDGYGEILGDRGPAYGKPVREIWADAWERIRPNARARSGRRDPVLRIRAADAAPRRRRAAGLADLRLQSDPRRGRQDRRRVRRGHRGQPRRRRRGPRCARARRGSG